MNRRTLLRGMVGAAGAAVGAFALSRGVDAHESEQEAVQGQVATTMPLANGGIIPTSTMVRVGDGPLPRHTHPIAGPTSHTHSISIQSPFDPSDPQITITGPFGGEGFSLVNPVPAPVYWARGNGGEVNIRPLLITINDGNGCFVER